MARVAHAMAMENPLIYADVIEVQEFPQLAQIYRVRGVPKILINNSVELLGAVPEEELLKAVLQGAGRFDLIPQEEQGRV